VRRPLTRGILLLFLFLYVFSGCEGKADRPANTSVAAVGDMVVDFRIKTFVGGEFDLADTWGRPVVINFWASWCGPCKMEAETLERVYLGFRDRGVVFVGVALQDTEEGSKKFIKRYGLTFTTGPDPDGAIMKAYNVFGIPKTLVVRKDGRVSYIRSGPIEEKELVREIKKVL